MSESNNIINLKICLACGKCEDEVKFQPYRKLCTKCNSRKCNEKILSRNPSYFNDIMKERYIPSGKVGRPRKITLEIK